MATSASVGHEEQVPIHGSSGVAKKLNGVFIRNQVSCLNPSCKGDPLCSALGATLLPKAHYLHFKHYR